MIQSHLPVLLFFLGTIMYVHTYFFVFASLSKMRCPFITFLVSDSLTHSPYLIWARTGVAHTSVDKEAIIFSHAVYPSNSLEWEGNTSREKRAETLHVLFNL